MTDFVNKILTQMSYSISKSGLNAVQFNKRAQENFKINMSNCTN